MFFHCKCGKRIFSLWWAYGKILGFCKCGVQRILPNGVYFGVQRWQQPQYGAVCLPKHLWTETLTYKPQIPQFLVLSLCALLVAIFHMVGAAESVFCLSSVPCLRQQRGKKSIVKIVTELSRTGECQQIHCPSEITLSKRCQVSGAFGRLNLHGWFFWNPLFGVSSREWLAAPVRKASFFLDLVGAVGSDFLEGQVWRLISPVNWQGLKSLWLREHFQKGLTEMGRSTQKAANTITVAGVLDWIKWRNRLSACILLSRSDCIQCDQLPLKLFFVWVGVFCYSKTVCDSR